MPCSLFYHNHMYYLSASVACCAKLLSLVALPVVSHARCTGEQRECSVDGAGGVRSARVQREVRRLQLGDHPVGSADPIAPIPQHWWCPISCPDARLLWYTSCHLSFIIHTFPPLRPPVIDKWPTGQNAHWTKGILEYCERSACAPLVHFSHNTPFLSSLLGQAHY